MVNRKLNQNGVRHQSFMLHAIIFKIAYFHVYQSVPNKKKPVECYTEILVAYVRYVFNIYT